MREKEQVEVAAERDEYAACRVHAGMQGELCHDSWMHKSWIVRFPEYGAALYASIAYADLRPLQGEIDPAVNERISAAFGEAPPRPKNLKQPGAAVLAVEKPCYAKDKVHKGMQGEAYHEQWLQGGWGIRFPEYGGYLYTVVSDADLRPLQGEIDPAVNERISAAFGETPPGNKRLMEMDTVELITEKPRYAREGVHKGMQGWICDSSFCGGAWLVNFPQCGENPDIATISIDEEDLERTARMDAAVNERIREAFKE